MRRRSHRQDRRRSSIVVANLSRVNRFGATARRGRGNGRGTSPTGQAVRHVTYTAADVAESTDRSRGTSVTDTQTRAKERRVLTDSEIEIAPVYRAPEP